MFFANTQSVITSWSCCSQSCLSLQMPLLSACPCGHGQDQFFQFLEIVHHRNPNKDKECFVWKVIQEKMDAAQSLSKEDLSNLTILSSIVTKVQDVNNDMMEQMSSTQERVNFECIGSMAVNIGGKGCQSSSFCMQDSND